MRGDCPGHLVEELEGCEVGAAGSRAAAWVTQDPVGDLGGVFALAQEDRDGTGAGVADEGQDGVRRRPAVMVEGREQQRLEGPGQLVGLVRAGGVEPPTSCSQGRRATGLRHALTQPRP